MAMAWVERLLGRTPERRDREKKLEEAIAEVHSCRQQLHDNNPKVLAQLEAGRQKALDALKDLRGRNGSNGAK